LNKKPTHNFGLASGGQSVHIEIFHVFSIGSGLLARKVLLKPARKPSLVRYETTIERTTDYKKASMKDYFASIDKKKKY